MTWFEQLTGRVEPPEWKGQRALHLRLSEGDEPEAALVPVAPLQDIPDAPLRLKCHKCERNLPATTDFFYRARREKRGFMYECKACHKTRQQQLRRERGE